MQDLIAGRVITCATRLPPRSRRSRATTSRRSPPPACKRSPALPNIPTAKEQGLDFDVCTWQGLFLAKDTPRRSCSQLNAALSKALDLPWLRGRFETVGEEVPAPDRRTPGYFRKFVAGEIARWSGPIKASGVTVE